jgi:signal transduction histidine kinase
VDARDDFLAVAAHELRSPLNAVALRLSLLEKQAAASAPQLTPEIARTRKVVDRYVSRAAVLLDVARLNAGVLEPHRERVDIEQLVINVVDAYREEAAIRDTVLTTRVDNTAAGCWDPHMVEQILANLVNNAIKYGDGAPVEVRAGVDGGSAWFEVADQGPGIDEQDKARVFEKFERLAFRSGARSGYGLGLWIVGSMLSAHGGSIQIASAQPRGSVFKVKLPLKN